MSVKIDLPYHSQFSVKEKFWQNKSCGIACVKMVLDFFKPDNLTTLTSLIKEGVAINGYERDGWRHNALIILLRNHGVLAYGQEFRSLNIDLEVGGGLPSEFEEEFKKKGIEKIKEELKGGRPVIASVKANFDENNDSHLIVLTGFDDEGFFFNNPENKNGAIKKDQKVSFSKFNEFSKSLLIFTA